MSAPAFTSALYLGRVMHARLVPVRHHFRHRVFSLYLDLDELPALDRALRLFSVNRLNMLSFHDRDHGPGDGTSARDWAAAQFRGAHVGWRGGPIRLLCFPRLWGYVFNPLAVYFAFHPDERPAAVLYQVSNTFGERHSYLLPALPDERGIVRHGCAKRFYVSPFFGLDYRYDFRWRPPAERLALRIAMHGAQGSALIAHQTGVRRSLSDRALAAAVARHPLMTIKVMAAIHWQALRLWRKGLRVQPRPRVPFDSVSQDDRLPSATVMKGDAG